MDTSPTATTRTEPELTYEHPKAPRKRRRLPPVSESRKALSVAYRAGYEAIPACCQCPRCGLSLPKNQLERHHPAGRRKAAFLFTVQTCSPCHQWTHAHPKDAEAVGLLWPGRNSKTLTLAAATELVVRQRFPAMYSLDILKAFSLTKP